MYEQAVNPIFDARHITTCRGISDKLSNCRGLNFVIYENHVGRYDNYDKNYDIDKELYYREWTR